MNQPWPTLPEPNFIERDPQRITAETVAAYEAMTGKTLQPAQVERLIVDLWAYRETMTRVGVQEAAKQNLLRFASAPILDYHGELVGTYRLPAAPARTTVAVTFRAALAAALEIPAGTSFATAEGIAFRATERRLAAAGATGAEVPVEAAVLGTAGNGYLAGQINTLLDALGVGVEVEAVANIGVTYGGAEAEDDARLRERIRLAPESFSVAGPELAYRYHALRAHQDIVDVAVRGPELELVEGQVQSANDIPPGVVRLYPLAKTGLPGQAILDAVAAAASAKKVRPLGDLVQVQLPVEYPYTIVARLTLYREADADAVLEAARTVATRYAEERAARLARDVVPSQIEARLSLAGVYEVELTSPAQKIVVPEHGWAHCTAIDIQFAGVADG